MFAHPIMLAGICGALLPVVIHLLGQARVRSVRWGAMMFLRPASAGEERLTRLRMILLLLLRMAIVAVLAMALARPMIGSAAPVNAPQGICAVLLFDNSAGMAFDEGTQGRRIETARAAALAVLNRLDRADEVHLIPLVPDNSAANFSNLAFSSSDLQSALSQLTDIQISISPADLAAALTSATRIVNQSALPRKVILILSDREASAWKNITDSFAAAWREQTLNLHESLRLLFVPIGSDSSSNVSVERVFLPTPIVRHLDVPIDVLLHNYGKTPVRAVPIELRSIGQRYDEHQTVDIPAGTFTTARFIGRFPNPGPHILAARIEDSAAIPGNVTFDDESDAIADVVEPLRVCIVTPDNSTTQPATEPAATLPATTQAATDSRLMAAIAPFQRSNSNAADFAIASSASSDSTWRDDLNACNVCILDGVRFLSAEQVAKIQAFVFRGGGLLVLPDNDGRALDQVAGSSMASGLLPATLSPAQPI
ncbi:MAG: BatA domain-containing protein, partial [Phycisphaerae bacterium]|nr:BatA domain-containing protein [Phycisphaerae bacterium]